LVQACAALADAGRPEDAPRLRRAAARVMVPGGAPEEVQLTRRVLDAIVDVHRQGRERREQIPTPEHVRAPDTIDEAGLAELLPGRDWFYAKVSNPRLVWSSARAALARLSGGSAADRQMVGEVVKNLLARAGTGLFADDAGLDLSRGIECATNPKISSGEVCTAWVTDRDRVLTLLAERDFGEDDGLVLPLHVAQGFAKAPRFLSALPLFLPGMLVTEDPAPEQPIVFEERVRTEVLLGPHRLHSSLIVRGHPGEIDIDEEHYLFVGDRMFAFTTRRLANAVLGASTKVLAADPEFIALAQRLHGDAGIVGAGLGAAAEGNASTIELAVDERGLRFRQLVRNEDPIGDAAEVIAQLPADAAATWSVGSGAPREELAATTTPGDDEGTAPPAELSRTRGSIAFGWYPRAGEGLWHDWAIALEPTEQDRRALARAKLIPRSPGIVRAGVHAAVRDRLLVYASSRVLLDRALTTQAGGARARVFARGSFRGGPSSTAVNAARSGELAFRRFLSLGLGVVESAEYQADDEAGAGLLAIAGRITLALADDDRPSDVVDAWLAAHDDSNSILLPRPLQPRDLAAKLTYVLEVVEPEAFVQRVLSGSPRQGASIEPPGSGAPRVRVTVTPDSAGELVLSAAERRRALAPTRDYPADAARVRELLPVIIGKQTDPNKIAALVVAWVHKRIRYEITPRRVDGAKVLENGRGDCSEYATLTVTLLRAAGVPAQERSGMMASGTDMTAHAWAAYHDGKRWHEIDPTAGTASVTAGHLEMSVIDVLALDAVGGLKVIAIE
ncbi:MAG: transglutaminase domain-containing protein, partial [Deltaproteobacteria bacterium]|nr:transglutaminase domain-containing protein [Nannocystaceae bacterium]